MVGEGWNGDGGKGGRVEGWKGEGGGGRKEGWKGEGGRVRVGG